MSVCGGGGGRGYQVSRTYCQVSVSLFICFVVAFYLLCGIAYRRQSNYDY